MSNLFGQIVFVVWRESIEALLVIGILNAWLQRQPAPTAVIARRFLWGGVGAGAAAAAILAWVLVAFSELLEGDREDYFQMCMVFVAAALILQMVFWMRSHAGGFKESLERGAERLAAQASWWGLAFLAAIAVMREGSETVIFLYGIISAASASSMVEIVGGIVAGFAAAMLCYSVLQAGVKYLSWKLFFTITEIVLLFLAASLLITGLDRAIGLDLISPLSAPLWNSAWLLDDGRGLGGFVAGLTGYRARPELLPVLVYGGYWLLAGLLLFSSRRSRLRVA